MNIKSTTNNNREKAYPNEDDFILDYIRQEQAVQNNIDIVALDLLYHSILDLIDNNQAIYILGNGGSASNASHWANDLFTATLGKNVKISCLSDNIAIVTACANDYSYEDIYSLQLNQYAKKGDLLIGLSVSGESPNIVNAFKAGKKIGCKLFSIIGKSQSELERISDFSIVCNSDNYGIVEDVQQTINHIIATRLKGYFRNHK